MKDGYKAWKVTFAVALLLLLISAVTLAHPSDTLPAVGTQALIGRVDGVDIEVVVQSPAAQETPLQIVCVFEYVEGDIFNSPPAIPKELNGLLHVDQALNGLITDLRGSKKFYGKALETLLIIPSEGTIPAKRLLLIGLGSQKGFDPETMRMVGVVGMREALRMGVASYSHASDLKDAGFSSPTADVTGYVIQGALDAYRTQAYLRERNSSEALTVKKVTLLSGPAYFEDSKAGIKKAISTQVATKPSILKEGEQKTEGQ